jgi:hypothetical protein
MSLDVQHCFLGWKKLMVWALYQKHTQNHIKMDPSGWKSNLTNQFK